MAEQRVIRRLRPSPRKGRAAKRVIAEPGSDTGSGVTKVQNPV
jgi:hypothetical protein